MGQAIYEKWKAMIALLTWFYLYTFRRILLEYPSLGIFKPIESKPPTNTFRAASSGQERGFSTTFFFRYIISLTPLI